MNRWQCDRHGCRTEAVGVGGAVGLRAVGWYYHREDVDTQCVLFCPAHRPDPMPCQQEPPAPDLCEPCSGEIQARALQALMPQHAPKQRATTERLTMLLMMEGAWPPPGGMGPG